MLRTLAVTTAETSTFWAQVEMPQPHHTAAASPLGIGIPLLGRADWYPPTWQSRLLLPRTWLLVEAWRGSGVAANYQAEVFH
jgi:hypothetical protein